MLMIKPTAVFTETQDVKLEKLNCHFLACYSTFLPDTHTPFYIELWIILSVNSTKISPGRIKSYITVCNMCCQNHLFLSVLLFGFETCTFI